MRRFAGRCARSCTDFDPKLSTTSRTRVRSPHTVANSWRAFRRLAVEPDATPACATQGLIGCAGLGAAFLRVGRYDCYDRFHPRRDIFATFDASQEAPGSAGNRHQPLLEPAPLVTTKPTPARGGYRTVASCVWCALRPPGRRGRLRCISEGSANVRPKGLAMRICHQLPMSVARRNQLVIPCARRKRAAVALRTSAQRP